MTAKYLDKLNAFFVKSFSVIMRAEEQALASGEFNNLSYKEIHCIAAAAELERTGNNTAKTVAYDLGITQGTLTVCVNALVRKGCLRRERHSADKRQIFICLTDKGRKMALLHKQFHENMVQNVGGDLDDVLIEHLSGVLTKLTNYFSGSCGPS